MLHRILNKLRAVQMRIMIISLLDGDLLSFIFLCVRFIHCKYNENEHTIRMKGRNMNPLITYDMSMCMRVNVCVNSRTLCYCFSHLLLQMRSANESFSSFKASFCEVSATSSYSNRRSWRCRWAPKEHTSLRAPAPRFSLDMAPQ